MTRYLERADDPPWLIERRKLFMRPDAQRYLRPDYARFLPPGLKTGFNPDQPRDEQGRWTDAGGGAASTDREDESYVSDVFDDVDSESVVLASAQSFGTLIGQSVIRNGIGLVCFYKFSYGIVMVAGATNLGCSMSLPSSAVVHGQLIGNYN